MTTDLSIPSAPDPPPEQEMWSGTPHVVLDGERYAIGWLRSPAEKGGPAYVTARRGILGGRRVLERYPLTDDGWARAWAEFARLDPAAAEKTRAALARLSTEAAKLSAERSTLAGLVLSAVDPPTDGFAVGQAYDLRFGEEGLQIARPGSPEATAEYRYADVAAVQVTGFERVLTGSKIVSAYVFLSWPAWMADQRSEYRIHLQVQTSDQILEFWHTASSPGEDFGRWLEPVNRAIRQAWLSAAQAERQQNTEWLVSELSRLAERLEHATLTKSDFDLLKGRIIGGY
jgi:hypothetical protein